MALVGAHPSSSGGGSEAAPGIPEHSVGCDLWWHAGMKGQPELFVSVAETAVNGVGENKKAIQP